MTAGFTGPWDVVRSMAVLPKPQLDFLLETTFTQKVKRCASSRICGSAFLLNGI